MSDRLPPPDTISQLQRLSEPRAEHLEMAGDAELLELYVESGSRPAMEALIRRYTPLVASVCRLTVADRCSAEDAFQATFLVLLKSADRIRRRASLAAWLHGVAYRSACRLRNRGGKLVALQEDGPLQSPGDEGCDPLSALARKMELEALDRELENLPERLRAPLVEHYLLGFTAPQIAERMELTVSTVEGRLRRGRRVLRSQLARRGISLSILLAASSWFQQHMAQAEASGWTDELLEAPNAGQEGLSGEPQPLVSDPRIASLVRGELSMLSSGMVRGVLAAGVVLAAGMAIGRGVGFAVGPGDSPSTSVTGQGVALTLPAAHAERAIIAQFGGAGASPGASAPLGIAAPAQSRLPAGSQSQSIRGGRNAAGRSLAAAQNQSAAENQGEAGAGQNADPVAAQAVEWQRPESDTAGGEPRWLAGGRAALDATEANRATLYKVMDFDFKEVPLGQVVGELQKMTGTQFALQTAELDLIAIAVDTPISVEGTLSVRELLRRIGEPLQLGYVVHESSVTITSHDAANASPTIRFYDLSYVLPNSQNAAPLVNAVQQTVRPDSWQSVGGTSVISLVGSMMIVSAPEMTHIEVEGLLVNLAKMNPHNAARATYVPPVNDSNMLGGMGGGGMGGGGMGMGGGGMNMDGSWGGGMGMGGGGMF